VHLPLLESANDWTTLEKRITRSDSALRAEISVVCTSYLTSSLLPSDALGAKREAFRRFAQEDLWRRASAILDGSDSWTAHLLELYLTVGGHRSRRSYRPNVQGVWEDEKEEALQQAQADHIVFERTFGTFATLARLLDQEGLRDMVVGFDSAVRTVANAWLAVYELEQGATYDWSEDNRREREEIAAEYRALAKDYETLAEVTLLQDSKGKLLDAAAEFEACAAEVGDVGGLGSGDADIDDDTWSDSGVSGTRSSSGEHDDPFSDL